MPIMRMQTTYLYDDEGDECTNVGGGCDEFIGALHAHLYSASMILVAEDDE